VPAEPPLLRAPRRALHGLPARRVAASPHRRRRRRRGGGGGWGAAAAGGRRRRGDAVLGLARGAARVRRREPARGREIRAAAVGRPRARQGGPRECSTTYLRSFQYPDKIARHLLSRCCSCEFRFHREMPTFFLMVW